MSAWIFIIGLVLLWAGVSSRLARRERRNVELAWLNFPIQVATFWGRDAEAERQTYFENSKSIKTGATISGFSWSIGLPLELAQRCASLAQYFGWVTIRPAPGIACGIL